MCILVNFFRQNCLNGKCTPRSRWYRVDEVANLKNGNIRTDRISEAITVSRVHVQRGWNSCRGVQRDGEERGVDSRLQERGKACRGGDPRRHLHHARNVKRWIMELRIPVGSWNISNIFFRSPHWIPWRHGLRRPLPIAGGAARNKHKELRIG